MLQIGKTVILKGDWFSGGAAVRTPKGDAAFIRDRRSMNTQVPVLEKTWKIYKIDNSTNGSQRIFLTNEVTQVYFCSTGPFDSTQFLVQEW